jgi:glutathione S-transferase
VITLYTFGPNLQLPDPSPFVCKAMILLKMAGLEYRTDSRFAKFRKAPKGKLPYIDDDGTIVADSYFIRQHIEQKYGFDYDAVLDARQKAVSLAAEKLMEEPFYWAIVYARWVEPQNWPITSEAFFAKLPWLMRVVGPIVAQRRIRRSLHAQGFGRHSPAEIRKIATAILRSLSEMIGDQPFLMGDKVSGADATVLAFLMAASSPAYASSVVDGVKAFPNLVAYRDRLRAQYFGDGN